MSSSMASWLSSSPSSRSSRAASRRLRASRGASRARVVPVSPGTRPPAARATIRSVGQSTKVTGGPSPDELRRCLECQHGLARPRRPAHQRACSPTAARGRCGGTRCELLARPPPQRLLRRGGVRRPPWLCRYRGPHVFLPAGARRQVRSPRCRDRAAPRRPRGTGARPDSLSHGPRSVEVSPTGRRRRGARAGGRPLGEVDGAHGTRARPGRGMWGPRGRDRAVAGRPAPSETAPASAHRGHRGEPVGRPRRD